MLIDKFDLYNHNVEQDNLLEYVISVANGFAPDISIDDSRVPYKGDSQAPVIFKRRYNRGRLNVYFRYEDYISFSKKNNEAAIDIIQALDIDPDKFWYLLLFISDYVVGSTLNTLACKATPRQEIEQLISFIEQNEESANAFSGVVPKQDMELTLHIKGHSLKIDNPDTLSAIADICRQALPDIADSSRLNVGKTFMTDKADTVRIGLFADMLRCFFRIYPQFTGKRKTGNNVTKSTLLLISKLAYLTKLTTNADYDSDDENIKGVLKLYKKHKTDTINTIYG